jgi:hypothetical protein
LAINDYPRGFPSAKPQAAGSVSVPEVQYHTGVKLRPTLPKTALTEPAIAGPIGSGAVAVPRARVLGVRALLVAGLLFLIPALAYWSATFHDYGLRDDYSNLREAHEELGKVVAFCASHARPIYGWLLQATYGQTSSVQNLQWLRFTASLLLGALSLVSFRGLRSLGWSFNSALCFAILLALVPSSQVIAGWAIGWPYAVAALLAFGSFMAVDGALAVSSRVSRGDTARAAVQWLVALGLLVVSALIYQSSAMFYVVPVAAALITQRRRSLVQTARWAGFHLVFVAAALGLAYCIMSTLYSAHVFVKSTRIAFEHHWGEKIAWFLQEPLPNALSLFVLNDNNKRDHLLYLGCAALVGLILIAGAVVEWRRHGRTRGIIWVTGLVILPTFACAVSLIASERYATYRTILAMTAVLLCFLVASVTSLTQRWTSTSRHMLAGLALAAAYLTAQHHAYALIAVPQGNEWQLIMQGAKQVRIDTSRTDAHLPRIFAIASSPADLSTASIYHDEFGSLSSNSEWVPREMFKRAMHDLHPDLANLESRYWFATGPKLPADQSFDVIIDLHRLRRFYTNN